MAIRLREIVIWSIFRVPNTGYATCVARWCSCSAPYPSEAIKEMNGMNASTHFQRTLPRRSSILLLMVTVGIAILATGLLILVVASMPVLAALPGGNGSIAFTSQRDGNEEVYAMNADGADQTRLTHNASTTSTATTAGRDLLPSF